MSTKNSVEEESGVLSEQELKVFESGEWTMASDEPAGTIVPSESERWIATDQPVEVRR